MLVCIWHWCGWAGLWADWIAGSKGSPGAAQPTTSHHSSAQTNAGDPFCLDTESSTLLSIMDELEIAEDAADEAQHLQDVKKGCADQKAAILRDVPMAEDCAAAIAETLVALAVEAEMLQEGEEDPTELEPAEEEEALPPWPA